MLLATLTANLQSSYAEIQSQIEVLQEQQRLIQSQLQRVGSVESKMESAVALVAEAIAEIREVCPDELSSYRQVIDSLFGDAPIAQIKGSDDISTESEATPTPPTTDEPESVEVEAVEIDDTPVNDPTPTPTTAETTEEDVVTGKTDLPLTASEIKRIKWTDLQDLCSKKGIADPSGQRLTRKFAERNLLGMLTSADIAHLA